MINPTVEPVTEPQTKKLAEETIFSILLTISFSHLLNDTIQSLIPSIYPLVKNSFHLSFSQVGLITFTFQIAASILQPVVGSYTDKKPHPFSLAIGMSFTLFGLVLLSLAGTYYLILIELAIPHLIGLKVSLYYYILNTI